MTNNAETRIVFTIGRYNSTGTKWLQAGPVPTATIEESLFRLVFDAAGESTIDTNGDIDPELLLDIVERVRVSGHESGASLRVVCRWAQRGGLRVGFSTA